jgi:hypothetical protein
MTGHQRGKQRAEILGHQMAYVEAGSDEPIVLLHDPTIVVPVADGSQTVKLTTAFTPASMSPARLARWFMWLETR